MVIDNSIKPTHKCILDKGRDKREVKVLQFSDLFAAVEDIKTGETLSVARYRLSNLDPSKEKWITQEKK